MLASVMVIGLVAGAVAPAPLVVLETRVAGSPAPPSGFARSLAARHDLLAAAPLLKTLRDELGLVPGPTAAEALDAVRLASDGEAAFHAGRFAVAASLLAGAVDVLRRDNRSFADPSLAEARLHRAMHLRALALLHVHGDAEPTRAAFRDALRTFRGSDPERVLALDPAAAPVPGNDFRDVAIQTVIAASQTLGPRVAVAVTSDDPGEVIVNGVRAGPAPVTLQLASGSYDVYVRDAERASSVHRVVVGTATATPPVSVDIGPAFERALDLDQLRGLVYASDEEIDRAAPKHVARLVSVARLGGAIFFRVVPGGVAGEVEVGAVDAAGELRLLRKLPAGEAAAALDEMTRAATLPPRSPVAEPNAARGSGAGPASAVASGLGSSLPSPPPIKARPPSKKTPAERRRLAAILLMNVAGLTIISGITALATHYPGADDNTPVTGVYTVTPGQVHAIGAALTAVGGAALLSGLVVLLYDSGRRATSGSSVPSNTTIF